MSGPAVQSRRPQYCLSPQPARQMSRRGIAILIGVYVVFFGAAALRLWL